MSQQPSFVSVVKNQGFRYLWFNQILVQLAYNTLNFVLLIWVYKLTQSHLAVAALMLAVYLPALLFGLFAGVIVDLIDRKKIILAIDILLVVTFMSFILIKKSYPLILVNTFLINSLAQFFMPSESSSIPLLVSKKQLFLANSLFSLTLYGALMVGFSIGGPIVNTWGLNAVFLIGAAFLLVAFSLAQYLPVIRVSVFKPEHNFFSIRNFRFITRISFQEGKKTVSFIRSKLNVAVSIGLMSLVQGVIGMLAVMMPSYMENVLLIQATDASYFVMLPLGLGMVSGAYFAGRWFHGIPRRQVVVPAIIFAGIIFILIGIAPSVVRLINSLELPARLIRPRYFFHAPSLSMVFGFLAFLLGLATVSIIIPCQTVLQENSPVKSRGKIFAFLGVFMTGFSALPVILTGAFSDLFGVTPIFISLGMVVLLIGLVAKRPSLIFNEEHLPFKIREFLGLGHWRKVKSI